MVESKFVTYFKTSAFYSQMQAGVAIIFLTVQNRHKIHPNVLSWKELKHAIIFSV